MTVPADPRRQSSGRRSRGGREWLVRGRGSQYKPSSVLGLGRRFCRVNRPCGYSAWNIASRALRRASANCRRVIRSSSNRGHDDDFTFQYPSVPCQQCYTAPLQGLSQRRQGRYRNSRTALEARSIRVEAGNTRRRLCNRCMRGRLRERTRGFAGLERRAGMPVYDQPIHEQGTAVSEWGAAVSA